MSCLTTNRARYSTICIVNCLLENKALVTVLESEPMLSRSYQMVFEGCFENNAKDQMVSHIYGDGGHRL